MAQIILEHYATPHEAQQRVFALRRQGIHAWRYHDLRDVQSGADLLEQVRQTRTVAWTCVVEGLFDDTDE